VEEEDTEADVVDVEEDAETTDYRPNTAGPMEIVPIMEPNMRQNWTATSRTPLTPTCKMGAHKIVTSCDDAGQKHLEHP
jgi:hypothetical protein